MSIFSIIIPTYNSSQTIGETIKSVLIQDFEDFEVIVIDGASTDNTVKIIETFKDTRISIYSETDKGVYDAMNKGIEKSNGEWLYFLGSDDTLYEPSVLKKIYSNLDNNDFVYGNVLFSHSQVIWAGEFNREKLNLDKNICHQAIFYRKNLFKKLGNYNLKFTIWADWDFNIRCFSTPGIKINFVDIVIANYNEIGGVSGGKTDKVFEKYLPANYQREIKILENEIKKLKNNKFYKISQKFSTIYNKLK